MAKKASKKQRATKSPAELPPGQLNVRRVAIGKINPAPYNPRKDLRPGDPEYENIKRSLTEFGYVEAVEAPRAPNARYIGVRLEPQRLSAVSRRPSASCRLQIPDR